MGVGVLGVVGVIHIGGVGWGGGGVVWGVMGGVWFGSLFFICVLCIFVNSMSTFFERVIFGRVWGVFLVGVVGVFGLVVFGGMAWAADPTFSYTPSLGTTENNGPAVARTSNITFTISGHQTGTAFYSDSTCGTALDATAIGARFKIYKKSGQEYSTTAIAATGSVSGATYTINPDSDFTTGRYKFTLLFSSQATYFKDSSNSNTCTQVSSSADINRYFNVQPPTPTQIALKTPSSSPGNDTTPTFTVTLGESGGAARLYSDASCSTAVSTLQSASGTTADVTTNAYSTEGAKTVYAKHTNRSVTGPCSTAKGSYTLDETAPEVTYVVGHSGGSESGGNVTLTPGDKVFVDMAFSEAIDTSGSNEAPKVQFKNDGSDWGSEVTGTDNTPSVYFNVTPSGSDSAQNTDAIDFGDPPAGSGLTRETVSSGGYVYKVTSATATLNIRSSVRFDTGSAYRARWHTSKPTSAQIDTIGTLMWNNGSNGSLENVAEGGGTLTNVAAGTYIWFYPSASGSRTVYDRMLFVVGGDSSTPIESASSGAQSSADVSKNEDPIDFGEFSGSDFIEREALSPGYVYKITKPFSKLSIAVRLQFSSGSAMQVRTAATKPASAGDADTHGTLAKQVDSHGSNFIYAYTTLEDVAAGTYIWFVPTTTSNVNASQRLLMLMGSLGAPGKPLYRATYTTTGSDDEVTAGDLKYDVTNESKVKDVAGNKIADKDVTTISGYAFVKTIAATIGAVSPTTKAKAKTVALSGVTDGAAVKYKLITGSTCDSTAYGGGSGETTVTMSSGSGTATVTNESDNSKYLCFKMTKENYTDGYFISGQITGIDDTAPTVTSGSTTYHEGFTASSRTFGTAATGPYKAGDDIYTKITFSEDMTQTVGTGGTAKPALFATGASGGGGREYTYAGSSSDITLDSTNTNATGVVATSTGIYVVDDGTTDKVFAYNLDGTRNATADVTLGSEASNPDGIAATATHFLVLGGGANGVRGYTLTGTRDSAKDISDPSGGENKGITADSSGIYIVDSNGGSLKVYAYTTAGARNSGGDFGYNTVSGYPNASGITRTADGFYILDGANDRVLAFSTTGTYDSSRSFNLTTANANPFGITALANGDLLIADSTDNKLYRYNASATIQYEIEAAGTGALESGKCRPNDASESETDEYVCRYTVASGDTGAFTAVVGTGSTDIATNALANKYTHGTTLTLDTTPPTVTSSATGFYTTYSGGSFTNEIAANSYKKAGVTIYTKVTFSEDIVHTKADDTTARPHLSYDIGGTATQYDILNNGDTLASGDCKPNHATQKREYVCMYTIASGDNGLFTVKAGTETVDAAGNPTTAYTHASTLTADTTPPTATYTISNTGGNSSNSKHYLNESDTVSVTAAFSETVSAAPTVQFKNNTNNLGTAATAADNTPSVYFTVTPSGDDTANSADAIDFGNPAAGSGLTREEIVVGGSAGYVYKVTNATAVLNIRSSVKFNTGSAYLARWHTSKPTSTSDVSGIGTQLWSSSSNGNLENVAEGGGTLTNVAAGTYIWFYPSASSDRTVSDRMLFIAGGGSDVSVASAFKRAAVGE